MVAKKANSRPAKRSVRKRAAKATGRIGARAGKKAAKAASAAGRRAVGKTRRATGKVGTGLSAKPLRGVTLPRVELQRGAEGPGVKQLQRALVKLRLMTQAQMNTGPGTFGPITERALKKFQRAHGVDAIGVYGPKTRAAFVRLGAKLGRAPKPPASGHKNPFLSQLWARGSAISCRERRH